MSKGKPCHCQTECLGTETLLAGHYCQRPEEHKAEQSAEPLHPVVLLLAKLAANQVDLLKFVYAHEADPIKRQDLRRRIDELNAMGELFAGNIKLDGLPISPIVKP